MQALQPTEVHRMLLRQLTQDKLAATLYTFQKMLSALRLSMTAPPHPVNDSTTVPTVSCACVVCIAVKPLQALQTLLPAIELIMYIGLLL